MRTSSAQPLNADILVGMRITRRLDEVLEALIARVREVLAPRKQFRTVAHSCGQCYLADLDCTAEVLAAAEGEWFK